MKKATLTAMLLVPILAIGLWYRFGQFYDPPVDILLQGGRAAATSSTSSSTDSLTVEQLEAQILELSNQQRVANNLPALKPSQRLTLCGRQHSDNMLEQDFFEHVSPKDGSKPIDRVKAAGVQARIVGENLYECEGYKHREIPSRTVQAWMKSDEHRKNLLDPDYKYVGVGICLQGSHAMVTQVLSETGD